MPVSWLRRLAVDTTPLQVPAFKRLFLGTVVTVLGTQTRSTAIPALAGLARTAAANALNMTVTQAGIIGAPLIAGLLIGAGDLSLTYAVDAVGLLIAVPLLRGLPPLWPAAAAGSTCSGRFAASGKDLPSCGLSRYC